MNLSYLSKLLFSSLSVIVSVDLALADCDPLATSSDQSNRWVVSQDGEYVYDTKNNWTWMRCTYGMAIARSRSVTGHDTCEGMPQWVAARSHGSGEGQTWDVPVPTQYADRGWSVPTYNQLASIIQPHCRFPVVDPLIFPNTQPNFYYVQYPNFVYDINFSDGSYSGYKSGQHAERAFLRFIKLGKL